MNQNYRVQLRSRPELKRSNNVMGTGAFCPETEEECKEFFREHYRLLCATIQTRKFYPHLMGEEMMDAQDKQAIDNGNLTDVDKAGALIDMMMTRGKGAFVAFMTVLEYEYPNQYFTMTNYQPRPRPESWKTNRMSAGFSMLTQMMKMLEQQFCNSINDTNQTRQQIQDMKNRFSATEEDATKELTELQEKLMDNKSKLEKSSKENETLRKELKEYKKNEIKHQEEIAQLKSKLSSLNNKLMQANGDLSIQRERSRRNDQVKAFIARSASTDTPDGHPRPNIELVQCKAEIDDLKAMIESYEKRIEEQQKEIDDTNNRLDQEVKKLSHAKMQYDVLEDDYHGDKRKYEESIERQNAAFRLMQEECRRLENERQVLQEKLETLDGRSPNGGSPDVQGCPDECPPSEAPSPRQRLNAFSHDIRRVFRQQSD